ncbi:hypothetical protein B296_00002246 [Ensete ventricosum]|uniref:Uncharacterized protein n=1 Tax=Ensete ventricosum TaxID=4639 RepID=A0A426Z781_ENSVE|nr:hypothetical protein B296_00002246 [Ensete ventricosum]
MNPLSKRYDSHESGVAVFLLAVATASAAAVTGAAGRGSRRRRRSRRIAAAVFLLRGSHVFGVRFLFLVF